MKLYKRLRLFTLVKYEERTKIQLRNDLSELKTIIDIIDHFIYAKVL